MSPSEVNSTGVRLARAALQITILICIGAFLFGAYIGSTVWWLNHSPWNSLATGSHFTQIWYKALDERQPTVKPTGYARPVLMPSYYTFRVCTGCAPQRSRSWLVTVLRLNARVITC